MQTIDLIDEAASTRFGQALAKAVRPGDVVGLEGDLGAGKTFIIGAAAHTLGVPEETPVTSPTFALIHEYEAKVPIVHIDFYRLDGASQVEDLGIDEFIGQRNVVFVEWGRRFEDELGEVALWIELATIGDYSRRATLNPASPRGQMIAKAIRASFK